MRSVLVVTHNPAITMSLTAAGYTVEDVRPHEIADWAGDPDVVGIVVLAAGSPERAAESLLQLLDKDVMAPVVCVTSHHDGWDQFAASAPGVRLLPLPLTVPRLTAAIDETLSAGVSVSGDAVPGKAFDAAEEELLRAEQAEHDRRAAQQAEHDRRAAEQARMVQLKRRASERAERLRRAAEQAAAQTAATEATDDSSPAAAAAAVTVLRAAQPTQVDDDSEALLHAVDRRHVLNRLADDSDDPTPVEVPPVPAPTVVAPPLPKPLPVETPGSAADPESPAADDQEQAAGAADSPTAPARSPVRVTQRGETPAPNGHPRQVTSQAAARLTDTAGAQNVLEIVRALYRNLDELYSVPDTASVIINAAVGRTDADAGAILVPDGHVWRVAAGVGLRPLEFRYELEAHHWLIREIALPRKGMIVEDSDIAREKLHGAPLASWPHIMAAPLPEAGAVMILARRGRRPFDESGLHRLDLLAIEAEPLLKAAYEVRQLARRLAPFRDHRR